MEPIIAGKKPIKVDLEEGKTTFGVVVVARSRSPFAMAHIAAPKLPR